MPIQYPALHAYTHLPGGSDPLPEAGGSSWEVLTNASPLTIASGGNGVFSFGYDSGALLVDLSNPVLPTILADGVYALSLLVSMASSPVFPGAPVYILAGSPSVILGTTGAFYSAGGAGSSAMSIAWTGFLAAGHDVLVEVINFDGSSRTYICAYSIVLLE